MVTTAFNTTPPKQFLPPPSQVRDRLSAVMAEARLLRQILKLSEAQEQIANAGKGATNAR